MSYIGGSGGALVLETQSSTGTWFGGSSSGVDPLSSSNLIPSADNTFDIGTNLSRLRVLHTAKINDAATGETLEIGNYTADTGVTAVYGQLQGKNSSWTLNTDSLGSALGSLGRFTVNAAYQIYLKPGTGAAYVDSDYGIVYQNRSNNATVGVYPAPSAGGSAGMYASGDLSVGAGSALGISATSAMNIVAGTSLGLSSTGAMAIASAGNLTLNSTANAVSISAASTLGLASTGATTLASAGTLTMNSSASGVSISAATSAAIVAGTTLNLTSTGITTLSSASALILSSSANDVALTAYRDLNLSSSTRDINVIAGHDFNLTSGSGYGIYINSNNGLAVRDGGGSRSIAIVPSSSGTTLTPAGSGNTSVTVAAPTVTLANQTTAACNISAGSASASTTTTTIGCGVAGSTNTINIGQIAANDVVNIAGTVVRSPEIVAVRLAADSAFGSAGTFNAPSMLTETSTSRYVTWDNTLRQFTNSHPTASFMVLVVVSTAWTTFADVRNFWVITAAGNFASIGWAAGDGNAKSGACMGVIGPGGSIKPQFYINTNETLAGGWYTNTNRFNMQLTVL